MAKKENRKKRQIQTFMSCGIIKRFTMRLRDYVHLKTRKTNANNSLAPR